MDHGIVSRRVHSRLWIPQADKDAEAPTPACDQQEESVPTVQEDGCTAAAAEAENQTSQATSEQQNHHGFEPAVGNGYQIWLDCRRTAFLLPDEHH